MAIKLIKSFVSKIAFKQILSASRPYFIVTDEFCLSNIIWDKTSNKSSKVGASESKKKNSYLFN